MKGNEKAVYYNNYYKFLLTAGVYDPGLPDIVRGQILASVNSNYNIIETKTFIDKFVYPENDPIAISNDTIILFGSDFLQSPNHWIIYLTNRDMCIS